MELKAVPSEGCDILSATKFSSVYITKTEHNNV